MIIKSILVFLLAVGLIIVYTAFARAKPVSYPVCDDEWWNALSEEWKAILLMNQNLVRNHINIYAIQKEYTNRLNTGEPLSEATTSLYDLQDEERFSLNHEYFYARVRRTRAGFKEYPIDLKTLSELDTLYIVGGPGDLTPLKNFPNLEVLIANFCGYGNDIPIKDQRLNLEALKSLKKIKVLHISSTPVTTLMPISKLVEMVELVCYNTPLLSLDPIKGLTRLKKLSIGSKVKKASAIFHLTGLEVLYVNGCKPLPGIRSLKKLKKLCIVEGEFSILKDEWRYKSIDFLKNLHDLEFLDIQHTSYRGDLQPLLGLTNLKAVSLSSVRPVEVELFKTGHPDCSIINVYEFER